MAGRKRDDTQKPRNLVKQRRSVPELVESREAAKQRIMDSELLRRGEPFTSHDVAKLLSKTVSCASEYLSQLVDERRLSSVYLDNRNFYRPAQQSIASISWRIDESVYEELEQELACF